MSTVSEPEPDIAVCRLRTDSYKNGHPQPEDLILLIEVSDTTLEKDLHLKGPLYANSGVPEYWILDVEAEQSLCFSSPAADRYQKKTVLKRPPEINLPSGLGLVDLSGLWS